MGFLGLGRRRMREVETVAQYPGAARRSRLRPATPGTSSGLRTVAYADVLGKEYLAVSREEAITVPAVANGRWLICHPLSRQPLVAYDGTERLAAQPRWLSYTGGLNPWQFRTTDTLDDLIFEGWALWAVDRDETDGWEIETMNGLQHVGRPLAATHIPLERWDFDADDGVLVDDKPAGELDVILFRSPMDPLLMAGRNTIRGARALEEKWQRALDGIPVMEIRQTEDIELQDPNDDIPAELRDPEAELAYAEAQQIVDDYVNSLREGGHGVVLTPNGYELVPHGSQSHELFTEARNFQVLDIARHLAIPPHLMGASQVAASLTYTNTREGKSDYRELVQVTWAMAMEARLSMNDLVPPGVSVRFDLSDLTATPDPGTGTTTEDS